MPHQVTALDPERGRGESPRVGDQREPTLGGWAKLRSNPEGVPHRSRAGVQPVQGWASRDYRYPGCAPASRPWAMVGNPIGVQSDLGRRELVPQAKFLSPHANLNGLQSRSPQIQRGGKISSLCHRRPAGVASVKICGTCVPQPASAIEMELRCARVWAGNTRETLSVSARSVGVCGTLLVIFLLVSEAHSLLQQHGHVRNVLHQGREG